MKKYFLLVACFIFSLTLFSQGNKGNHGKGNDKTQNENSANQEKHGQLKIGPNEKKERDQHAVKIWKGTTGKDGHGPKLSKNQPAKVSAAFQRDYPNAGIVSWSKYRGDWTTNFQNGPFVSTAVYHANGDRRDTRTVITRNEVPEYVLHTVLIDRPGTTFGDIVKIETPNRVNNIFRFKDLIQGKTSYFYYDGNGQLVKYNY